MTLSSGDLGTFAEAVHAAETARGGFVLADIAAVPSAWETIEGSLRSFGWIVELRLGGRRYLQCKVDADSALQDVAVTMLPSDGPLPAARSAALWFEPEP